MSSDGTRSHPGALARSRTGQDRRSRYWDRETMSPNDIHMGWDRQASRRLPPS